MVILLMMSRNSIGHVAQLKHLFDLIHCNVCVADFAPAINTLQYSTVASLQLSVQVCN